MNMPPQIKAVLVIGASGFVGGHLAKALLADGYAVRCLARDPAKAQELAASGCEVVQGDISDLASVRRAVESVQAVYISVHTLSPQTGAGALERFMEIEKNGLLNIVAACREHGARRLVYVTSLGISADARSEWLRGRWETEQLLLNSELDTTVIRPGQIVGAGGRGFEMMVGQAKRRVAVVFGTGRQKWRNIALSDLIYYLVGVLNDSRSYGKAYDVGNDDILTNPQMIDMTAELLGRPHPYRLFLPPLILNWLAPRVERSGKLPPGAMRGLFDSMETDAVGDPLPIRRILPRPPLPYREAVERALATQQRN